MKAILAVLFCTIGTFAADVCLAKESERPNILLIAIDDLNDWTGCLGGHPQAHTPNIDRLAKQGTLFSNASCQAPICGPSRLSLLSGKYPHETGCYHQPTKVVANDKQLVSKFLPLLFSQHGYKTLSTGKISHGVPEKDIFQLTGIKGSSGPKPENQRRFHYTPPQTPFSGTQTDWGIYPEDETRMPDHQSASWAIQRLEEEPRIAILPGRGICATLMYHSMPSKSGLTSSHSTRWSCRKYPLMTCRMSRPLVVP